MFEKIASWFHSITSNHCQNPNLHCISGTSYLTPLYAMVIAGMSLPLSSLHWFPCSCGSMKQWQSPHSGKTMACSFKEAGIDAGHLHCTCCFDVSIATKATSQIDIHTHIKIFLGYLFQAGEFIKNQMAQLLKKQ